MPLSQRATTRFHSADPFSASCRDAGHLDSHLESECLASCAAPPCSAQGLKNRFVSQSGQITRQDVIVRTLIDHAPCRQHPFDRCEVQHVRSMRKIKHVCTPSLTDSKARNDGCQCPPVELN